MFMSVSVYHNSCRDLASMYELMCTTVASISSQWRYKPSTACSVNLCLYFYVCVYYRAFF